MTKVIGGIEPHFQKRERVDGKEGGAVFTQKKLKSEIFSDKKVYKKNAFLYHK